MLCHDVSSTKLFVPPGKRRIGDESLTALSEKDANEKCANYYKRHLRLPRPITKVGVNFVIALTFFALFSPPSPSFSLTTSRPYPYFLYPATIHSLLLLLFPPFFTRVKNKTKWPTAFF